MVTTAAPTIPRTMVGINALMIPLTIAGTDTPSRAQIIEVTARAITTTATLATRIETTATMTMNTATTALSGRQDDLRP